MEFKEQIGKDSTRRPDILSVGSDVFNPRIV
jgi:hypothetical protein